MPRAKSDLIKANMYVDPTVKRAMHWLAEKRGVTYSELMRQAAREWVTQEIQKEKGVIQTMASTEEEETPQEPTPAPTASTPASDATAVSPSVGDDQETIGPIRRAHVPSGRFQVTPG